MTKRRISLTVVTAPPGEELTRLRRMYRWCEEVEECAHDLSRGVLITELLGGDGPEETDRAQVILSALRRMI